MCEQTKINNTCDDTMRYLTLGMLIETELKKKQLIHTSNFQVAYFGHIFYYISKNKIRIKIINARQCFKE